MGNIIQVKQLNIQDTKGRNLIDNMTFSVEKGKSIGIVGESGSGKSLTMKFILGLLPKGLSAQCGGLDLLGQNPYMLKEKERKSFIGKNIGYIPQNTVEYLHPLIKIKSQIIDGYVTHRLGNEKEALDRAILLLDKVGLKDPVKVLNSLPQELSGGMRQRVNIAMAMMTNPELIIADEPTTALDAELQYQVMELIKNIHEETDNSMIIISHNLSLIEEYCDYVIVMYKGKIQEANYTEEIFNNPRAAYTKALLSVILTLDQDRNEPLKDISMFLGKETIL